jgi:hypothetical protein
VAGTLTVTGMSAGLLTGQKVMGPMTMVGNTAIGGIIDAALVEGNNDFLVPAGAVGLLINLGMACAATVLLRSNLNSGDAGFPIGPYPNVGWTALPLVTGTTEIILNASVAVSAIELSFI